MIISIIGKGGVGKTTITANLGTALATFFDKKVLLIDGNVKAPNLCFLFNLPESYGILDLIKEPTSISKANTNFKNLKVISSPFGSNFPLDFDIISSLFSFFSTIFDFIFIDTPPSFPEETIKFMELSDYILIIVNPEPLSIIEAYRAMQISQRLNRRVLGILVNKYYASPLISLDEIRKNFSAPVIGIIPQDINVQKHAFKQEPFVTNPTYPASKGILNLASYLVGREIKVIEKESLWSKIKGFIGKIFRR
ncbi:hypothetical protein DRN63_01445 [Nanoarchaeota archaeon]|nr:MAG: hypothetical protein DRN63_01445 [Nanoarchaeota archaeon]